MSDRVTVAFVLLVSALWSAPVAAQHRIKESTTLEVTLGSTQIADKTAQRVYPLGADKNLFIVRRDVTTKIVVVDTNPLLFEYAATKSSEVSAEYAAAVAFAEVLQKLLANFPDSAAADRVRPTVEGFDPVMLRVDLEALMQEIEAIPARLRESVGGPAGVAKLKAHFDDPGLRGLAARIEQQYAAMFNVARKCLDGAQSSLAIDGSVAIDCDAPYDLALALNTANAHAAVLLARAQVETLEAEAGRALTNVENRKPPVAMWTARKKRTPAEDKALQVATSDLEAARAALATAQAAAAAAQGRRDEAEAAHHTAAVAAQEAKRAGHTLRQFMALAMGMDARVQKQAQTYRELIADVDGVGDPFEAGTHEYSVKDIQHTKIEVKARKKWQAFMPADVQEKQKAGVRTVLVSTDAYRPVHLAVGPAFVLGFVKNPTFQAVKDGDDYKIVKTEEELTRYDIAAMLNLTPDAWQEPTFGGFFQVGVSPKKNETGFYFGGGIRSHTVFTFGAGFMMQQVRKLGPGLTETSRLTTPDDLETAATFKPGFYLHITVALPTAKK